MSFELHFLLLLVYIYLCKSKGKNESSIELRKDWFVCIRCFFLLTKVFFSHHGFADASVNTSLIVVSMGMNVSIVTISLLLVFVRWIEFLAAPQGMKKPMILSSIVSYLRVDLLSEFLFWKNLQKIQDLRLSVSWRCQISLVEDEWDWRKIS